LFFSHLSTTIPAIEVYLSERVTYRDLMPTDTKELAVFKAIADKAESSIILPLAPKRGRKKKVVKDLDAGALESGPAADLIAKLGWDLDKFGLEWRTNKTVMDVRVFARPHRVARRRGERLIVMSGLTWNSDSQNKPRDFSPIISAFTLETAFVELYREDLLLACFGARLLRKQAHKMFLEVTMVHHKQGHLGSEPELVMEWEFTDAFPIDIGSKEMEHYDPVALRKDLDAAHATVTRSKRDPVRAFVVALEKNKLLLASDPKAKKGSIESLAHDCITTLAHVSRPTPSHLPLTFSSF
jgi:hypothetical protein